jgi:hypothetical protein
MNGLTGSACRKKCGGHLIVKVMPYRNTDDKVTPLRTYVCDRCGQAHGLVFNEGETR